MNPRILTLLLSLTSALGVLLVQNVHATDYYILPTGGTATQCDGTTNTGINSSKHCAWNNPMQVFPPSVSNGVTKALIKSGDTLHIGAGQYLIGYSATNASLNPQICYPAAEYACVPQPLPSGVTMQGDCTKQTQLWGTEGAQWVLNLDNTSNVKLSCLEITDHSSCIPGYSPSPAVPGITACSRSWGKDVGTWAQTGIHIQDATNPTLDRLFVHGLVTGINAGRTHGIVNVPNIVLSNNSSAGWNGDLGGNNKNSTSDGTTIFTDPVIKYNGCSEIPPSTVAVGCFNQETAGTQGGYGDGFGLAWTGGTYIFQGTRPLGTGCAIYGNTSDGIDTLYANGTGSVKVDHCWFYGNVGNDFKVSGNASITSNVFINRCTRYKGTAMPVAPNPCRATGSEVLDFAGKNEKITFAWNTLVGEGNCLLEGDPEYGSGDDPRPPVDSSDVYDINNNIFVGKPAYNGQGQACFTWFGDPPANKALVQYANNIVWQTRNTDCSTPGLKCIDPLLKNEDISAFDWSLKSGSPAAGAGIGAPPAVGGAQP
jgi:hypothetical protein